MKMEIQPPFAPMEALLVDQVPRGDNWLYEPKWDGFRCLVFRDGDAVELQSKASQSLTRYFPEIVENVKRAKARRFVLDTEIVIPEGDSLSFEELLLRIHPAESRVRKLAHEHPALLIAFDLLADSEGRALVGYPLRTRRRQLEQFFPVFLRPADRILLSPISDDFAQAVEWLSTAGVSIDGIVAKRADLPYQSDERTGMQKVKRVRSADCVVGGFRYATNQRLAGSLLLGLYDQEGLLHHVGFTSGIRKQDREKLTRRLEKLIRPPGFTGRAPGGKSRWSTARSEQWEPLDPTLVVEVTYSHFSGGRFRHGTRLLRWRPDKPPAQCTFEQVSSPGPSALELLRSEMRK
jgi:ATP-dependent DNA ligase